MHEERQPSPAGIPPEAKPGLDLLFKTGLLGKDASLGYVPAPKPGTARHPSGGEGKSGPADHPPYPRVEAAC